MAKSTDSFSFECPRCQTMMTVGAESAGQTLQCKNCGGNLVVPGAKPASANDFDDLFAIEVDADEMRSAPKPADPIDRSAAEQAQTAETKSGSPPIAPTGVNAESAPDVNLWDLTPDLLGSADALVPANDPFAADENAPLRFDEFSGEPDQPSQFRVKCPVCDSVMFASSTLVGQQIQCSDCFSMIDVVAPEITAPSGPKPLDRSSHESTDDRLSAFPERSSDAEPEPIGDDYGLAPATEDMLKPRAEALPPELMDLVNKSYQVPAAVAPIATGPAAGAAPLKSTSTGTTAAAPTSSAKTTALPANSSELPYVEPPLPPMKRLTESEQFKWPEQFLCVFKDLNALQFAGLIAILLAIGYIIIDSGMGLYRYTENEVQPYRLFGAVTIMFAGGIHFFAMVLGGVMINQLVEGAAHQCSVFHPPDLGVMELVTSFLIVGVSFWAGMLPGIVLGQLFWGATRLWWLMFVGAFGTAFLIAPIGILGAYYNGSAFQIVSSEVLQSVRNQTAGWIRFYCWMALWILVFCLAWVFRAIPSSLIGSTLCGIVQAASLLLMGRTIGLLAQAFINFWITSDER